MAKGYYYILGLCISIKIVYLLLQIKQQVICGSSFMELGKSFIYCNSTIDLLVSGLRSSKFTLLNNIKSFVWFWDILRVLDNTLLGGKNKDYIIHPSHRNCLKPMIMNLAYFSVLQANPKTGQYSGIYNKILPDRVKNL